MQKHLKYSMDRPAHVFHWSTPWFRMSWRARKELTCKERIDMHWNFIRKSVVQIVFWDWFGFCFCSCVLQMDFWAYSWPQKGSPVQVLWVWVCPMSLNLGLERWPSTPKAELLQATGPNWQECLTHASHSAAWAHTNLQPLSTCAAASLRGVCPAFGSKSHTAAKAAVWVHEEEEGTQRMVHHR